MLFSIVLLISGAIGSLVLLNVSLVTLIVSVFLWIFTFLYAVTVAPILAIFYVLTGNKARGESLIREANKFAWRPLSWARHLIAFMWIRLRNYLSEADSNEPGQPTAASPHQSRISGSAHSRTRGYGQVEGVTEMDRRDRDAANIMLVVTAIFDLAVTIVLITML